MSAYRIQFIYMLLSNHPKVMQKLREEHTRVFHPDFSETVQILRDYPNKLNELEYTDAVIKETLRLFPVGFGVREAEQGTNVTYKGQQYPIDNHLVIVNASHALHYDSAVFPNPTLFAPERFLDDKVPRSHFRTFGRGSRACLGQNLAQDELKVILVMTLRDYDFNCAGLKPNKIPRASYTDMDLVYGDIIFQELGLEAKPRGGMMMQVKRIT
jgi:cytochrome P450